MAKVPDQDDRPEDASDVHPDEATDTDVGMPADDTLAFASDTAAATATATSTVPTISQTAPASTAPGAPAPPSHPPTAERPSSLAELSALLRESAAEIAEIAAQAGRLGIAIDAAKALRDGTTPEALRRLVLQRAADASDARDIMTAAPSPILPASAESPIVAAAKRAAASGTRG